jgi:L-aminopeptidase/D-esterase-like protein
MSEPDLTRAKLGAMRGAALAVCATLVVSAGQAGAQELRFDFPGLRVGVAEYEAGPTGATVFYFPGKVKAAVDVRGGAPGTINTDALRLGYESRMMDAIVFAGGSWYGLAAATGVADEIKATRAGAGEWSSIAGVVAAIVFDLGDRRLTTVTPDYELGRAALRAASSGRFPLGARGAGRFVMQGTYFAAAGGYTDWPHSGQGGAFRQIGPTKIAVFTVVNALGSIVDREGRVVRCGTTAAPRTDCGTIAERLRLVSDRVAQAGGGAHAPGGREPDAPESADDGPAQNTTLTLVVTNQKLPIWALQRLAVQVHTSMGRAIQPFATQRDGDVLYAVTTDQVENATLSAQDLGLIASEVAWDAVLASVPPIADVAPRAPVPAGAAIEPFVGEYEFAPGSRLTVRAVAQRLTAELTGRGGIYFPVGRAVELTPAGPAEFVLDTPRRDRIRFDQSGTRSGGLTLNPGRWSHRATRVR